MWRYSSEEPQLPPTPVIVVRTSPLRKDSNAHEREARECPTTGIIRWASRQATQYADAKLTMFPAPMDYDGPHGPHVYGPPNNQSKKLTWKNSCLWGVTHEFGYMYIIMFSPKDKLITWRLFEEKDCTGTKFQISFSEYSQFKTQFSTKDRHVPKTPDGFMQNNVISRILEHLITTSVLLYQVDGDVWGSKISDFGKIAQYFKGYRMIKISNIKKQVCDNLTRDTKNFMCIFVGALSMMDKSLVWESFNEKMTTTINLVGTPQKFVWTSVKYEFHIETEESEFEVEHSSFHWFVRGLFHYIEDMFERREVIISELIVRKKEMQSIKKEEIERSQRKMMANALHEAMNVLTVLESEVEALIKK